MFQKLTLMMCFAAVSAFGGSGRIEISQSDLPITISHSGSYVLSGNLQGSPGQDGITISASDVTLDLNGFNLRGATNATGIVSDGGRMNLILRNGTVSEWGEDGVNLSSVSNCLVEGISASGNGDDGLRVGVNTVLHQCQVLNNGKYGIEAGHVSVMVDCTSRSNTLTGIIAGDYAAIQSTSSRGNGGHGIAVRNYSTLTKVATRFNGSSGVQTEAACLVADSIAHNNAGYGFRLQGPGSKLEASTAYGNGNYGVWSATLSMIEWVSSRGNTNGGFQVGGQSFMIGNIAEGNGGTGFRIDGNESRIEGNHSSTNTIGFEVNGGDNLVIQNSAVDNGTPYSISAGNYSLIITNPETSPTNFSNPWSSYAY